MQQLFTGAKPGQSKSKDLSTQYRKWCQNSKTQPRQHIRLSSPMTIRVADQFPERVSESLATVDVVIPVYGERAEALDATLRACVQQIQPIEKIVVVDDGS